MMCLEYMFIYKRKAQYHETDQMGVIHHSNYVKWMEEARIAFMDELGIGYSAVEKSGIVSPVVGINVEYKKPVYFGDQIEIRVSVNSCSGVKTELSYEFHNVSRDELCCTAASRHCFMKDGRIISLKKEMPALYEKLCL